MGPILAAGLGALASGVGGGIASSLFGGGGDRFSIGDTRDALFLQNEANLRSSRQLPSAMVEGANRAGIHPGLVFGASGVSPPSWTTGALYKSKPNHFQNMGQDISRAVMAAQTEKHRQAEILDAKAQVAFENSLNAQKTAAEIGHTNMQNQLIAAQIKKLEAGPQLPPPFPSKTNRNSAQVFTAPYDPNKQTGTALGKWESVPAQVISADKNSPSLEAGPPQPGFKKFRIGGDTFGGNIELPGQAMSESLEAMGSLIAPAYVWGHNALRTIERVAKPPLPEHLQKQHIPKDYYWDYNYINRTYKLKKKGG